MAAKKKAAKAGAGAVAAGKAVRSNEYVQRLVKDEELRENLRNARSSRPGRRTGACNGKGPGQGADRRQEGAARAQGGRHLAEGGRRLAARQKKRKKRRKGRLLLLGDRRRGPGARRSARACARRSSTRCSAPRRSSSTPPAPPRNRLELDESERTGRSGLTATSSKGRPAGRPFRRRPLWVRWLAGQLGSRAGWRPLSTATAPARGRQGPAHHRGDARERGNARRRRRRPSTTWRARPASRAGCCTTTSAPRSDCSSRSSATTARCASRRWTSGSRRPAIIDEIVEALVVGLEDFIEDEPASQAVIYEMLSASRHSRGDPRRARRALPALARAASPRRCARRSARAWCASRPTPSRWPRSCSRSATASASRCSPIRLGSRGRVRARRPTARRLLGDD